MRIDSNTMLFHDLSPKDAEVLEKYGRALMFEGLPGYEPAQITAWHEACFPTDRRILVSGVVLPARIFYSLTLFYKQYYDVPGEER